MSWMARKHRPAYALLATALLGPGVAAAQAPDAAAAPDQVPANARLAMKLAGLVTFVANSCPELNPDYDRFKTVLAALGVTTEDLSKPEFKMEYLNYAAVYGEDIKGNCEKAEANFGAAGTTFPGVFTRK